MRKQTAGFGAFNQVLQFSADKQQSLECQYLPGFEAGAFNLKLRHNGLRILNPRKAKSSPCIQIGDAFPRNIQFLADFENGMSMDEGLASGSAPERFERAALPIRSAPELQRFKGPVIHAILSMQIRRYLSSQPTPNI